jgi:hypothetical protein
MSGIFDKVRHTTGLGLNENELYERAFTKGVLLHDFKKAADIFQDAARKFSETGNQAMAAQASANAMLYHYLATGQTNNLSALIHTLHSLQQIESIGLPGEMMPVEPLCAELDCRMVEAIIAQALDDVVRLRDLHKLASAKFQAIIPHPLITYAYIRSGDGHHENTEERYFYHHGMYQFYEAMIRKDSDPSAAAADLALAIQSFRRCNDQSWLQKVTTLLENWRISRTCWICHREMQGFELHFSMCRANVTPYTQRLLEVLHQDNSTVNLASTQIAVCNPCGSMVTFKAAAEADKVRQELTAKLEHAHTLIKNLESRVRQLERRTPLVK